LGRNNLENSPQNFGNLGFTLIEILIAITVLGMLVGMLVFLLDPFKQLGKANDIKRESDFKQITNALDTYYNDKAAYPSQLDDVLNDPENGNYMQKIPQDPVNDPSRQYLYLTDFTDTNPQWFVLFAQLDSKPANKIACPLEKIDNCLPADYVSSGYNYCVYGGDVNCSEVSGQNLNELRK